MPFLARKNWTGSAMPFWQNTTFALALTIASASFQGCPLLLREGSNLVGSRDLDLRLYLRFCDLHGGRDERDPGRSNLLWHIFADPFLVKDDTPDEFGVVH